MWSCTSHCPAARFLLLKCNPLCSWTAKCWPCWSLWAFCLPVRGQGLCSGTEMLRKACTWYHQKQSLPVWCRQHPKLVWLQPCSLHTLCSDWKKSFKLYIVNDSCIHIWMEHQVAISEPFGYCKSEPFGYCKLEPFGYCKSKPFGYCKSLLASVGKHFALSVNFFLGKERKTMYFSHMVSKMKLAEWFFCVKVLTHTHMKKTLHFTPS